MSEFTAGNSALHRAPAGRKLAALLAFSTVLIALRSPVAVAVAAALVVVGYLVVARLGVTHLIHHIWPLRWLIVALVPFQWWAGGWKAAVVVVGTLVVAVSAAALVTATTRLTEMLDFLINALRFVRPLGIDPERVALVLALTMRSIPVLAGVLEETRQARRARGLERSSRALIVPLVVRTVRHADRIGEALTARGLDD